MTKELPKWRIDSLDARAGLAFASWRVEDIVESTALFDRPVFHFSPPAFTPIPVASPATAIAAERHGFQLGLFDGEGEVPFESLDDVSEFVRRTYIGNGRTDGTEGGGGPAPLPLGGEPPDLLPGPIPEGRGEGYSLGQGVAQFLAAATHIPRGFSSKFFWLLDSGDDQKAPVKQSLILHGAELAFAEMVSRFPYHGHEPELRVWQLAANRLVTTFVRLGLMDFLIDSGSPTEKICLQFIRRADGMLMHHIEADSAQQHPVWAALCLLAGRHPRYRRWEWDGIPWQNSSEPLDDLAHFPVGKREASVISAPAPAIISMADALSSVLASPGQMAKAEGLEAIIMFSAARIVAFDGASPTDGNPFSLSADRARARLAYLTAEANKWLARELPRLSFSLTVEKFFEPPSLSPTLKPAGSDRRQGHA